MPYKHTKFKIAKSQDRRIKLTDDERNYIKKRYEQGESQRSLAREYKVDKATIRGILNPEWYKEQLEKRKNYMKTYRKQMENKVHAEYQKNHRKYKQSLYLKGELKKSD